MNCHLPVIANTDCNIVTSVSLYHTANAFIIMNSNLGSRSGNEWYVDANK